MEQARKSRKPKDTPPPTPRQLGALAANEGKPLTANPFVAESARGVNFFSFIDGLLDAASELDLPSDIFEERFRPIYEWRAGWWDQRRRMDAMDVAPPGDGPAELVTVTDAEGRSVEIARYSDDMGTPEMRQRQEVYETEIWEKGKKVVDGKEQEVKEMRKVRRVRDLMGDLHRRGLLSLEEMKAGRDFRRDFEIGQLDPRRAPDIRRVPGGGGRGESDRVLEARAAVGRAMDALGGHGCINGQCAWWCLGCGWTPREWGARKVFGAGRAISEESARGIVIGTVGLLKAHYDKVRIAGG